MKAAASAILLAVLSGGFSSIAAEPEHLELSTGVSTVAGAEGIWQMADGGAIFRLRPKAGTPGVLEMLIIDAPDYTIPSGMVTGEFTPTAVAGRYDVSMLRTDGKGRLKTKAGLKRSFSADIDVQTGTMALTPYDKGLSVNLFRLIPYLFRVSVTSKDSRPAKLDGAVRLSPNPYENPVIL